MSEDWVVSQLKSGMNLFGVFGLLGIILYTVFILHILLHNRLKLSSDAVTFEGFHAFAIDVHRRDRRFARTR